MHYSAGLLALAAAVEAKTHMVKVGWNDQLAFSPATLTAAKGDTVQFMFYPMNHSVVQGTVDHPCWPTDGAFFSGYAPVPQGEEMYPKMFDITVENEDPIWFYCSQDTHCNAGMAGVINPAKPTDLATYKQGAKQADIRVPSGQSPIGGKWVAMPSGGGSSSPGGSTNGTKPPGGGNGAGSVAVSSALVGGLAGFAAWALL